MSDGSGLDQVSADVRGVLADFRASVVDTLAGRLEGIVLFGSLVGDDFDPATSDLDLLVATSDDPDDERLEALRRMHDRLASTHPAWDDRLDVVYVPAAALQTFRERESPLVVISRGEPIHRATTDRGWIMNWHAARERGVSLLGPPPHELIAATSAADLLSAVRGHVRWMLAKVEDSDDHDLRAYAIVTACRALYTCSTGSQASKRAATLWAERRYPGWAEPIRAARGWRRQPSRRSAAKPSIVRGLAFLRFAAREVARASDRSAAR